MATALVVRAQRYKKIGDKTSPLVYILKRKPRDAKMYDLKRISEEIEAARGQGDCEKHAREADRRQQCPSG